MAGVSKFKPISPLGEKWKSLNHFNSYANKFQINVPTENYILDNYRLLKSHYESLLNQYPDLVAALQDNDGNYLPLDVEINDIISKIQQNGNLWAYARDNQTTTISRDKSQEILQKWQGIIATVGNGNFAAGNQQIKTLTGMINALSNALANTTGDTIDFSTIVINAKNDTKMVSIARRMQGVLNGIEGAYLEYRVKEWLMKILPEKLGHGTATVTGNINIFGNGNRVVNMKTDVIASILDNIEITNEAGEVTYRIVNGQITPVNGTANNQSITLTDYEVQSLSQAVLGFSAKTTKGRVNLHSNYNVKTLLTTNPDIYTWQLYHFFQLGFGQSQDIYMKYAISKVAKDILGSNNAFMVSRTGIIPMTQYLEDIITNKGLRTNFAFITRGENAPLNTDFGSVNITGPHL